MQPDPGDGDGSCTYAPQCFCENTAHLRLLPARILELHFSDQRTILDGHSTCRSLTIGGIIMASDASFVQFVVDQIDRAGEITSRKMFGEYALYCNAKVVALICDNKLFVKPTEAGRTYIGNAVEAPAYPGAKPSFLIEDKLEDRKWLTELIRITEKEVLAPKPKKTRNTKTAPGANVRDTKTAPRQKARDRKTDPKRTTRGAQGASKPKKKR